jgi:hypothetical protein
MNFKIHGEPLSQYIGSPILRNAVSYLDSLPDGELILADDLAKQLKCSKSSFQGSAATKIHPYSCGVRMDTRNMILYGNKRTIASLKIEIESGTNFA